MKQRKRTKRRILSVLLTLVMVFSTITGIVPGGVMTAKAEETYNVWVGGTQVTSENAANIPVAEGNTQTGTASYNAETNTLTLDGFSCDGEKGKYFTISGAGSLEATIYSTGDLIINVASDSTITSPHIGSQNYSIFVAGKLTVQGSGKLYSVPYAGADYNSLEGIYAQTMVIKTGAGIYATNSKWNISVSNIIVEEGGTLSSKGTKTMTAIGGRSATENLVVNGTVIAGSKDISWGINAGIITVNENGTVTATGKSYAFIGNTITINNGGKMTATTDDENGTGINCSKINIKEGAKLAVSATSTVGGDFGRKNNARAIYKAGVNSEILGSYWDTAQCLGAGYEISKGNTNFQNTPYSKYKIVKFPRHSHSFEAGTGENTNTITTICDPDDCYLPNGKATVSISAPLHETYGDGKSIYATISDTYNLRGDAYTIYYKATKNDDIYTKTGEALTSAPTNAGDYVAEITLGDATASVGYTVAKKAGETIYENTARNGVTINYTDETATPNEYYEISVDGMNVVTPPAGLTDLFDSGNEPKIYVRKAETENILASNWVGVSLTPRPAAPTLMTNNASSNTTADGLIRINDLRTSMEYSDDGGTTWTDVMSNPLYVIPGTYLVRSKAISYAPHGLSAEATVGVKYKALTEAEKPVIAVSGNHNPPVIEDVLTASTTATDVIYEWYRDGEKIEGENNDTYTLTKDDAGKKITVKAIQTKKDDGTDYPETDRPSQTSDPTGEVVKKTPAILEQYVAKANITISYPDETAIPTDGYEVSVDNKSETGTTKAISITSLIDETGTPTIYVRTKETDDTKAGEWVALTLTGRNDAPGPFSTEKRDAGKGTIAGMNDTMQYSADNGKTWTNATNESPIEVNSGNYLIRTKATDDIPASKSATLKVESNYDALTESNKPTISVSDDHNPPVIGDELIANTTATDVIYEWYRDGEKIEGENKDTYTLTKDDAGKKITVKAIQTKKEDGTDYPENDRPSQASDPTGEVVKKTPAILEQYVAKANITISYPDETAIPTDGYEVSVDNKSETGTTKAISITSLIDETGTPTIYVRTKETDDTKAGEWVALTLTGRNDAPGPFSTEKRDAGKGTIAGMNDTMQYSADNGKTWTNATNESPIEVNSGNYLIRTKATDDIPASKSATLKVESNYDALTESNKPTISVSDDHNPPVIGDKLTASTTATDILYEWYRDGEKIEGENKHSYTLTKDDAGKKITAKAIQTKKDDGTDYPENDRPSQASDPTGEVVKKTPAEISADTAKEGIVINYPDEAATPKDGYEVTTDKDSAEPSTPPLSLTEILDGEETPTIYVRTKETDENKAGEWVEVTLPARPDAPTGLKSESATSPRVNDGKIINTATTMEYKLKDRAEEWKAATDNETTGLAAGTYSVRYKATDADLHSKETTVTVGSKEIVLTDGEKPTAKADITYTGEAQELLDAPKDGLSEGVTRIQYAIGTDDKTEPADGWGDSVPIGTDAGIYYVWYKAIADSEHTDCIGGPIAVTIAPAEATVSNLPSASAITYGQKLSDSKLTDGDETGTFTWKTPETVPAVADSDRTEYEVIFTPKDTNYKAATCKVKVTVNKAAGKTPSADAVKTANASSVSASDGKLIFDGKNTYQYSADDGVTWTDVKDATSVSVKAGTYKIRIAGDENNEPGEPITVKVTVAIPETTKVPQSESVVTPEEEEKATLAMNEGLKISQTKSKINISWGKVDTAAGYDVYVQYCGSNFKKEPTAGTNKTDVTKVTVKQINGKKLNLKKNYKIYIKAYKLVDGKKVSLAKTITGHIVGRKNTAYTNVKMIKLAKSKYTVTAGKTATIKAKTVLVDKRKKQLSNAHAPQFRYASSDNKIATVSKKGKIKGIAKGQCSVYVYARNGYARKITVTVK